MALKSIVILHIVDAANFVSHVIHKVRIFNIHNNESSCIKENRQEQETAGSSGRFLSVE